MRLLAYTDNVEWGGADTSMAHVLARLDPAIEVAVLGVSEPIVARVAAVRAKATSHIVARPSSGHDVRSLRAHVEAVRALRPDVVHASLSSPWSCQYCIAAAAITRRPAVVAVYQLVVPPIGSRQWLAKRLTVPAVDRHVGVGEQVSREVEATVGLRRHSVVTIHNGVPDEQPVPLPAPAPAPLIGAVGRVEEQKGFDLLIRALPELGDVTLAVIGDGGERAGLERLAGALGVADRVLWLGWHDEPRRMLSSFDVFVLPSRFEGFPLVLLEALLARSAVVATDVGSVREVVRDGVSGLLVPPEDPRALAGAVRRLLGSTELRARLGAGGRRLVLERFTAAHMTRAFERLYGELLP